MQCSLSFLSRLYFRLPFIPVLVCRLAVEPGEQRWPLSRPRRSVRFYAACPLCLLSRPLPRRCLNVYWKAAFAVPQSVSASIAICPLDQPMCAQCKISACRRIVVGVARRCEPWRQRTLCILLDWLWKSGCPGCWPLLYLHYSDHRIEQTDDGAVSR